MDDRNASIIYSTNTDEKFSQLQLGTNYSSFPFVNSITYAYNNTFTLNLCQTSDGCQILIPFTGSGITVYVIQVSDAGNFTVKVDDGKTASKTLPYLDGSWSNITLCDIQSLPYEDHMLTVVVQNWTDSKGIGETSSILFDFAAVNETVAVLSARSHYRSYCGSRCGRSVWYCGGRRRSIPPRFG